MIEFLQSNLLEVLIIPLVLIFYISFFIVYFKTLLIKQNEKRVFKAINELFASDDLDKKQTLSLISKEIITNKKMPYSDIKNECDLLEYIFRKETLTFNKNGYLSVKFEKSTIINIQNYLISLKKDDPFISLNSQYNYYFSSIYKAINENNKDYGITMLNQLSKEFETIDETIIQQNKRNKISYFVSVLGFVLTIFFGIFSLIK
mgnify:CR=1 FL=1